MKDGIKIEILKVAKEEFFKKGFAKTSMRVIAQKADISFSNIYYYYKNKDALFLEVVKPLKKILDEMFSKWHNIDDTQILLDAYTDEEYQKQSVKALMDLTLKFKDEFYLLLCNSQGSELENLEKIYIQNAAKMGMDYVERLAKKYPDLNIKMSRLFMLTMNAHIFTIMGEIVSQDLSPDEINQFMKDLVLFNTSGWKGLIYANKNKDEALFVC